MRSLPVLAFALVLAGAAAAQPPPAPAQPTPAQVAANRAEGDRIIAKTRHPELFENVTVGELAQVRHRPSGAVCNFSVDDVDHGIEVVVVDLKPTQNIQCHANGKDGVATALMVGKLSRKVPLDFAADAGKLLFTIQLNDLGTVTEAKADQTMGDAVVNAELPPRKVMRFMVRKPGADRFARREVSIIGDWNVASDFIAPADLPMQRDIQGALMASIEFKAIADAQKATAKP
jgi:hypothetical protein